jgi:hypothetical protein
MLINGLASTIGQSVWVPGCVRARFYAAPISTQFLPEVSRGDRVRVAHNVQARRYTLVPVACFAHKRRGT